MRVSAKEQRFLARDSEPNCRYIIRRQTSLLRHVVAMGAVIHERVAAMPFNEDRTINARGLAIGIELETKKYASRVQERCRKKGLLLSNEGSTLLLLPPLNIEREVVEDALDILSASLR